MKKNGSKLNLTQSKSYKDVRSCEYGKRSKASFNSANSKILIVSTFQQ